MGTADVLAHVLTPALIAALAILGARLWREHPERFRTRGLAGTALLCAFSALLAGYLLTMAQPDAARLFLTVYARASVIAAGAMAVLGVLLAVRASSRSPR